MASTVRDIMRLRFDTVAEGDTVLAARARLIESGLSALPVRDAQGNLRGTISLTDVDRVRSDGRDPAGVTAGEVAASARAVDAGESLDRALAQLTDGAGGRLPVVEGAKLVGTIGPGDIVTYRRALSELGPDADPMIEEISEADTQYLRGRASYFWNGVAALRPIRAALATAGRESVDSVLDFGSGHGRALRALKAAFPQARLTACDLDRDAVDFCARTFGATPVYSHEDPAQVRIDDRFDLIWCCSLLTHVDAPRWPGFLEFFSSLLAPGGVLVFTTHGRRVAADWRAGKFDGLTADLSHGLLADYERSGFGYRDYPRWTDYGLSCSRPSWVCGRVERTAGLGLVGYTEWGWSRQDTVACIRTDAVETAA
jgi:SAM-dependent methyltransferase/CBS domain-containing protein